MEFVRVEFPQGVPEGCTQWLRENVGIGNVEVDGMRTQQWMNDVPEYAWFYERLKNQFPESSTADFIMCLPSQSKTKNWLPYLY